MVGHNNFVSIYDLEKKEWTSHLVFDDIVRCVFDNDVNQKTVNGIGVLYGPNRIKHFDLEKGVGLKEIPSNAYEQIPYRVVSQPEVWADKANNTGIYFFCDMEVAPDAKTWINVTGGREN